MCELIYNRISGLIIGSSIADSMGSVVKYAPDTKIESPEDALQVDIQPGYWTEPTTLLLNTLTDIPLEEITQQSTGMLSDYNPVYGALVRAGALAVRHHRDFYNIVIESNAAGGPICKLWAAIIDTVLHGGHKHTVLSRDSYANILLPDRAWRVLDRIQLDPDLDQEDDTDWIRSEDLLADVLRCFKETNNYKEGLIRIINESMHPEFAGALYGQIAGAYYGITDIPAEWLDTLQGTDLLVSTFESRECV